MRNGPIQYNTIFVYCEMTERSSTRRNNPKKLVRVFIQHALDEVAVTQFVYFRDKLPIMAPGSEVVGCANFARKERG